jgi:hypothetical protein
MTGAFFLCLFCFLSFDNISATRSHIEYKAVGKCLNNTHGAAGRYIARVSGPGAVAVAQDMGCIPWNAPDVTFVDTIGLTDSFIARSQYDISYTPYIRYLLWPDRERREQIKTMDRKLREYLYSRNPKFFVINISIDESVHDQVAAAIKRHDKTYLEPLVKANSFYYSINSAPQWADFQLVRGWEYSPCYFLLLYER